MKSIVGVSIIAIVIGWAGIGMVPAVAIVPDEAILKLLPPETEAVAFIDVAALRASPLVQDAIMNNDAALQRELGEFMSATGFDPRRDLDKVTIAKIGPRGMLAIGRAQYDRVKVEQFIKEKGGSQVSSEAYMGRTIYTQRDNAFSFIDNLVILGDRNAVRKAIDQMSLPGSMPLRADLMDSIRTIEAGNQVWAVGDMSIKDVPANLRGPAPAAEIMKSLKSGTYQMRVDQDLHAKAVGNFEDPEAARSLSELARGFIAIFKIQAAKDQPDFVRMLDGIQVNHSGTSVVVNIDQPGDLLKKLPNLKKNF